MAIAGLVDWYNRHVYMFIIFELMRSVNAKTIKKRGGAGLAQPAFCWLPGTRGLALIPGAATARETTIA